MKKVTKKNKLFISIIVFLILAIGGISYAYYVGRLQGNESSTTIDAISSYMEVTYSDGTPTISASDLAPGWSASKTFSVSNTGSVSTEYYLKIYNINNPLVNGGLSYKITSANGGTTINKSLVPSNSSIVSNSISIAKNATHNYSLTVYYDNIEADQISDLGKSFSFDIGISGSNKI